MTSTEANRIQYADPVDPWEMLDTPWGHIPAWKASTLATGALGSNFDLLQQVRNDAASIAARHDARERELQARADAISARELQHAVNVTQFVDFVGKASVLFDRLQKARADAEEEPLASPPGPPGDQDPDEPAGDPGGPPDPSLELEDAVPPEHSDPPGDPAHDPRGDFLRLAHPVTLDAEVEFPEGELPHPPVVAQPIAAGLDEGD